MPDFNYGDFTQQGIENKVTLKARLNERRYVTLDLQSDVEGPNLTISGNVHDELNNIDYPIGSAPNGNIAITENGENINVAPYATATVNVESGGIGFVIPEQVVDAPDSGRVALVSNFQVPLTDNIIVQLIGTAYGQPIHALLICNKTIDTETGAQYTGMATSTIGGASMTVKVNLSSIYEEGYWGLGIFVNDVQTAFNDILISAIAEWETTPV